MSVAHQADLPPEVEQPMTEGDIAWEAGQALAADVAQGLPDANRTLEAVVRGGLPYLLDAGIVADLVRARPGCIVISVNADWHSGPEHRQRFVAGWIEELARYASGDGATIVPFRQSGENRVYTLLWVAGDGLLELPVAATQQGLPAASHALPVPSPERPKNDWNFNDDGRNLPVHVVKPERAKRRKPKPKSAHALRIAWLRRRGWMLFVGLIAGLVGGFAVSQMHHATSYTASATVVVRSGASIDGPGSANDAEELAVTYAALLPNDQSLVTDVSKALGVPADTVGANVAAIAESGTALVQVSYTASTASAALAGANAVASSASSDRRTEGAIAGGSVAVVSQPATATANKSVSQYGLILGAIFGLLIGGGIALISERSDRRVDDVEALADASGANVTEWPGDLSSLELVRGLGETGEVHAVTVMPMHAEQSAAAHELAAMIDRSGQGLSITVTPAADTSTWQRDIEEAPVVLVVGPGERVRSVRELTERLRLLRAAPAWSVLAVGSS